MKTFILALAICADLSAACAEESPLSLLVDKSDVVVRGSITYASANAIVAENGAVREVWGSIHVDKVLKGDLELKGQTIKFSHKWFPADPLERVEWEHLFKKDSECIVFLIEPDASIGRGWETADQWLAFQPPRPGLVRDVLGSAEKKQPEPLYGL